MNLGNKLKPCPFCGRKMVFIKETHTNKFGNKITSKYYMHEESNTTDIDCILDVIDMPFTIGAGDANEELSYIGEHAEKWNIRAVSK